MKNRLLLLPLLCLTVLAANAQSLWTTAEMKIKLAKGLSANIEGENRTTDGISGFDRWTASAGLDYKPIKWLKLSAGYSYIYQHNDGRTTKKGNIIVGYWQPRHRLSFAVTGSYDWNRFTFSLRERYQYTYRPEKYAQKYDGDDGSRKDDEYIEAKKKHALRSRFEVDYNVRKSGFTPFASVELYNDLAGGFATDKTRWTIGTEYKFSKMHAVNLYYRYINNKDEDDPNLHVIGIGYKLSL